MLWAVCTVIQSVILDCVVRTFFLWKTDEKKTPWRFSNVSRVCTDLRLIEKGTCFVRARLSNEKVSLGKLTRSSSAMRREERRPYLSPPDAFGGMHIWHPHRERGGEGPKKADKRNKVSWFLYMTIDKGRGGKKNVQASYVHAPLGERTGKESFEFRSPPPQTDKWSNESNVILVWLLKH